MTDPRPTILVVDDEARMREFLRVSLASHDYGVVEAGTAALALQNATRHGPHLILLDPALPDREGIGLVSDLRSFTRTPIIIVSARAREDDKVAALDAGADDYLTKPFGVKELLARIRVGLRHAKAQGATGARPVIEVGPLRIDRARREVKVNRHDVHLTPIEYRLLVLFAENAGSVLTQRQIQKEIWGPLKSSHTHHVRVHVAQLRKKIETDPAGPKLLLTEPAVGYRLLDR